METKIFWFNLESKANLRETTEDCGGTAEKHPAWPSVCFLQKERATTATVPSMAARPLLSTADCWSHEISTFQFSRQKAQSF